MNPAIEKSDCESLLVFRLPKARWKALDAARAEAVGLMSPFGGVAVMGGPYGDPAGLFYLTLPTRELDHARSMLPRLGYTEAVELIEEVDGPSARAAEVRKWKRRWIGVNTFFTADRESLRNLSPDRREFILRTPDGPRTVLGYRGDGGPRSRRGLPVIDAKLLTNVVYSPTVVRFLDPFAGVGGVVIEAVAQGWEAHSVDIDPVLDLGLRHHGHRHCVATAARLPFRDDFFHALASEPPYEPAFGGELVAMLPEFERVIVPEGRIALLISEDHADQLSVALDERGRVPELNLPIDRKGTPVRLLVWRSFTKAQA